MTELSVTVPEEPADRSVVLDAEGIAWQRREAAGTPAWMACGYAFSYPPRNGALPWAHLLVERGPLTLLEPVSGNTPCIGDGWRDAGFTDSGCTSFTEPSPGDAPIDGSRDAGFDGPDCRRFAQTA